MQLYNILSDKGFFLLTQKLIELGYQKEIDWQRFLMPCDNYYDFISQATWVIVNSGMKNQIAQKIHDKIVCAVNDGVDISTVFNHKGKVAAIKIVISRGRQMFEEYQQAIDKLEYLRTIPYIGKITCYHLAKNLGHDCVKPDRHLVRMATKYNMTPDLLCETISKFSGEKKCVVDLIIWRACNLQIL